jgi:hypothetical protein
MAKDRPARRLNKMNIWTDLHGRRSFPHIAKHGFNSVRIVWLASGEPEGPRRCIDRSRTAQPDPDPGTA